jgi:hypothetical protein
MTTPLSILRGTSSLGPTADAAFAAKYLGRATSEIVGVFPDPSTWTSIAQMPSWAHNMAPTGTHMVLDLPMVPNAGGSNAQGATGAYDSSIITFAKNLAGNTKLQTNQMLVRVGREMNGGWYKWSAIPDPASYVTFFRRIVGLLRQYAPGVRIVWCTSLGTSSGFNPESAYPGDDVVDFVASDVYDFMWANPSATPQARWNNLLTEGYGLNWLVGMSSKHGKPIVLCETGLCGPNDNMAGGSAGGGGGDNPYFIYQLYRWAVANNVWGVLWLSTNSDTGNKHDMALYPQSAALMTALWSATSCPTAAGLAAAAPNTAALQTQITTLQGQVTTLQAQVTSLQAANAALTQAAQAASSQLGAAKGSLDAALT